MKQNPVLPFSHAFGLNTVQHFVIALLQAAQCSGYHAQISTIVLGFDSHLGCDCEEWKNTE